MRRRGMDRVDESQRRTAGTELDLIAIEQRHRTADALIINQGSIEALQIGDAVLIAAPVNFGMTARNHGGVSIDDDLTFRIATDARHFPGQLNAPRLSRAWIN